MFTNLVLAFFVSPTVVNSNVASFFDRRDVWEDRELPSCTYGWVAFCTANIVTEIPISIVAATVYWLPSYFAVGFPAKASISSYSYLMSVLWSMFTAGWGQWIAAFGPTYSVVANVSSSKTVTFNELTPPRSSPCSWLLSHCSTACLRHSGPSLPFGNTGYTTPTP